MTDELKLTQAGYDSLKKELEHLKNEKLPEVVERIDTARQLGDLSENAEYHEAKDDQGIISARIRELEAMLLHAQIVEKAEGGAINIGSKIIVIDDQGVERNYEIVDQTQADPAVGKISNESPLGSGFLGKKEGQKVTISLPAGDKAYDIKKVTNE